MTFCEAYQALLKFQATRPRNPVRVEMPHADWCELYAEACKGELAMKPGGAKELFGYPIVVVEGKPLRFIADDDRSQKS